MGSIKKHIGGNGETTFKVVFRPPLYPHRSKTFKDETTAILWLKYQELINSEPKYMGVKDEHRYLVGEIINLKYKDDPRTMKECHTYLEPLLHLEMVEITIERLKEHVDLLLSTEVRVRGSAKTNTGVMKLPSKNTVLRKFAYLSSAITHANKTLGTEFPNHCPIITAQLRDK